MSELPTPRELLIALHADWRLSRRDLGRLVAKVVGSARAPHAAGEPVSGPERSALPAKTATGVGEALASPAAAAASSAASAAFAALAASAASLPARGETGSAPPAWATAGGAIAAAAAEVAAAAALGARVITLLDQDYPASLAGIPQPPPVLMVRGALPPGPAVAIVGSRLADGYGLEVAAYFSRTLAAAGVVVVSGLARGIDAAAHESAMAVPAGRTVAVLGCGLGFDYPRGHAWLAAAIAARGALVSEFPCAAAAQPWRFPLRNRTIAGLAGATLVVQATPRSGSLGTARHARELGRAVFAVPGPVLAPLSWGPHELLRRGARLAGHPEDLLAVLAPAAESPANGGSEVDTAAAAGVLAALGPRAARTVKTVEQIAALAGLAAGAALSTLLALELAGRVQRLPGLGYRLAARARQATPETPETPENAAPCGRRRADGTVRAPNRPAAHTRNKEGAPRRW